MYSGDGEGGIQGFDFDCYYEDKDGNIANEFYVVTDSEAGDLKKIEDASVSKVEEPLAV